MHIAEQSIDDCAGERRQQVLEKEADLQDWFDETLARIDQGEEDLLMPCTQAHVIAHDIRVTIRERLSHYCVQIQIPFDLSHFLDQEGDAIQDEFWERVTRACGEGRSEACSEDDFAAIDENQQVVNGFVSDLIDDFKDGVYGPPCPGAEDLMRDAEMYSERAELCCDFRSETTTRAEQHCMDNMIDQVMGEITARGREMCGVDPEIEAICAEGLAAFESLFDEVEFASENPHAPGAITCERARQRSEEIENRVLSGLERQTGQLVVSVGLCDIVEIPVEALLTALTLNIDLYCMDQI